MRTLKNQIIIAALLFFSLTNCVKQPRVYVETGNILETNFRSTGAFNANDNAIGKIDSTDCTFRKFNGYKLSDKNVYVFENNVIPRNIKRLNEKMLNDKFNQASWSTDTFQYNLKYDALICEDLQNHNFYSRKAGTTIRESAVIDGNKVYRFVDEVYKEKYDKLVNIHSFFRPENMNLFDSLGISNEAYTMVTDRPGLKINDKLGRIDFANSTPTPLNTFDNIYFKPIEKGNKNAESFLIRVVLKKHTGNEPISKYFNNLPLASIPFGQYSSTPADFTKYLFDEVLPNYWPKLIRGYECNGCKQKQINLPNIYQKSFISSFVLGDDKLTPPLPIVANY